LFNISDVDESACIILKYKNGAMANLTYHTDAGKGDNNASILGKTGRIEVREKFTEYYFTTTIAYKHIN
jgi:predicted dehydrogenase